MLAYLLLVLGLVLLIKGADWLVRGASSIARLLRVSEFVVGLTVVSFGTSLPELVIGLIAGIDNNADLTIGNVVGSNIANILLVLGVASVIHPIKVTHGTVWREIPFTLLASAILAVLSNDALIDNEAGSKLGHVDGLVLLAFFSVFVYYIAQAVKSDMNREWVGEQAHDSASRSAAEIVAGLVGLVVGGQLAVDNAVFIAETWGVSQAFIGLTVIAIGTSLPELATSAVAALRRNVDIAVGNVVGSNIFNIFIVLGVTSTVHSLPYNDRNNFDLAVMVLTTLLLFVFMFVGRPRNAIQRREGGCFLVLYAAYLAILVYRG